MKPKIYEVVEIAKSMVSETVATDWVYVESAYLSNPQVTEYIVPQPGAVHDDDTVRIYCGNAIMEIAIVKDDDVKLYGISTYMDINALAEGDFTEIDHIEAIPANLERAIRDWALSASDDPYDPYITVVK